jgi:hypothetical protein
MAAMAASDEAHKKKVLIGKMHGKSIGNPPKRGFVSSKPA